MYEAFQNFNFLTNAEKQRNKEFDQIKKVLEQKKYVINYFINKTQRKLAILEAKLKKERLVALTALMKSKLLIAEMELYIMDNVINYRCQGSSKNIAANGGKIPLIVCLHLHTSRFIRL